MPVDYFGPKHAWSVSFHPARFKLSDAVKLRVTEVDTHLVKIADPLKIGPLFVQAEPKSFGTGPCLIFLPEKLDVSPGKRDLVEIDGLIRLDGRPATTLRYLVEFVSLE